MDEERRAARAALIQEQRDALWKWRWLGFRRSTPGFKLALGLLAAAAAWLALAYLCVL